MAFEQKDLSGALFKNKDKAPDDERAPDYTGAATVEGQAYFLDAWIKEAKSGGKYMSIRFKAKRRRE